jgi:prefoldin subunit 5
MKSPLRRKITYVVGAAILSPALLYASSQICVTSNMAPTAESYTWNFTKEGSQLLDQINKNVQMVRDDAAVLQGQEAELNWKTHSITLNRIKDRVNKAGAELCRLETIQQTLQPWQKEALVRIAPELDVVAKNTQNAIEFLQDNRQDLFNPTYQEYVSTIYDRAGRVNLFVDYAQMQHQVNNALERSS